METLYIYLFGAIALLIIIGAPVALIANRKEYISTCDELLGHPVAVFFYLLVTLTAFLVTPPPFSIIISVIYLTWMAHSLLLLSKYKVRRPVAN